MLELKASSEQELQCKQIVSTEHIHSHMYVQGEGTCAYLTVLTTRSTVTTVEA